MSVPILIESLEHLLGIHRRARRTEAILWRPIRTAGTAPAFAKLRPTGSTAASATIAPSAIAARTIVIFVVMTRLMRCCSLFVV
jgi:hypothetical protein